jgi:hypothetical protein
MNFFNVCLPFILILVLCAVGLFLVLFALAEILLYERVPSAGVLFIVFALCTVPIFYILSDRWIRATPTRNWKEETQTIDTAVILGFGLEKEGNRNIKPGKSNQFLLKWTLDNIRAETLLVQEGVWTAACKTSDSSCKWAGRELKRIHSYNKDEYVNTIEAAFCALEQMERLGKKKAVIVAHDLQLRRVAWDFNKVKKSQKKWQDFQFVIPEIPGTPFPDNSSQWHTRSSLIYKFVEVFLARPRDYIFAAPDTCRSPVS